MQWVLRCLLVFGVLVVSLELSAADYKVKKNIAYQKSDKLLSLRNKLDVYYVPGQKERPVVLFIHGGAWKFGDKIGVNEKPDAFVGRHNCVFVSTNYRFHPQVTFKEQGADIAKAILWVRNHISEYGGSPKKIVVMGHSAGAHLAALVATDESYLQAEGLKLSNLAGVVLIDGAGYDVGKQIQQASLRRMREAYKEVFTTDPAKQRAASPISHVKKGKGIPPFLILYVARRKDSSAQSKGLARLLTDAGVSAKTFPAQGKTHMTINRELGQMDDEPTKQVFQFLESRVGMKVKR